MGHRGIGALSVAVAAALIVAVGAAVRSSGPPGRPAAARSAPASVTGRAGGAPADPGAAGRGQPIPDSTTPTSAAPVSLSTESATVVEDLSAIAGVENSLTATVASASSDRSVVADDLAGARVDDLRTRADGAAPGTTGRTCGDAATVAADDSTARADLSSLMGDQSALEGAVGTGAEEETSARRDFAALSRDEAAATPPLPGGLVTAARVDAALAQFDSAAATARARLASLLAEGQSDVRQAGAYAADAGRLCKGSRQVP